MTLVTADERIDYLREVHYPGIEHLVEAHELACQAIASVVATVSNASYCGTSNESVAFGGTCSTFQKRTDPADGDTDPRFIEMCDPEGWEE